MPLDDLMQYLERNRDAGVVLSILQDAKPNYLTGPDILITHKVRTNSLLGMGFGDIIRVLQNLQGYNVISTRDFSRKSPDELTELYAYRKTAFDVGAISQEPTLFSITDFKELINKGHKTMKCYKFSYSGGIYIPVPQAVVRSKLYPDFA